MHANKRVIPWLPLAVGLSLGGCVPGGGGESGRDAVAPTPDASSPADARIPPDERPDSDAPEPCVPACEGRACGSDGCGQLCGACPGASVCDAEGQCRPPPTDCGDGRCGADEDCASCPGDCGCGEGLACDGGECVCVPACDGVACGPDGCGGECGPCAEGQGCVDGACQLECPDDCGEVWQARCTDDGTGRRLCVPDPERPGCTRWSRRLPCAEGRDCDAASAECDGRCLIPEVVFLVDRSSSMVGERARIVRDALIDNATHRARLARLGVRTFPAEGDACGASGIRPPAVEQRAAFEQLPEPDRLASTPIAAAFDGVEAVFGDPDEGEALILVTDGDETCEDERAAVEQARALRALGIRTFVVGISRQANGELLAAIAVAGGTDRPGPVAYYQADTAEALRSALDDIFARLATCACLEGQQRCSGREVEGCAPDGFGFGDRAGCPFGCDDATQACFPTCDGEAGTLACDGDSATRCAARGDAFEPLEDCAFGCRDGAGCNPVCRPGAPACDGDESVVCGDEGAGFEPVERCAFGCRDGRCNPVCRPGDDRCVGDVHARCAPTGERFEPQAECAFGCRVESGRCFPVCRPGTVRCTGDVAERCTDDGLGFAPLEACAAECMPGVGCMPCRAFIDERCGPEGLERCRGDGEAFELVEACACNPRVARCLADETPGAVRLLDGPADGSAGFPQMWGEWPLAVGVDRDFWYFDHRAIGASAADVMCRHLGWPGAVAVEAEPDDRARNRVTHDVLDCGADERDLRRCSTGATVFSGLVAHLECIAAEPEQAFCVNPGESWWYRPSGVVRREVCLAGCDEETGHCQPTEGEVHACPEGWQAFDLDGVWADWPEGQRKTISVDRLPPARGTYPGCAYGSAFARSDVFALTAPRSGDYDLRTSPVLGGGNGDTILSVRSHCAIEASESVCNDDGGDRYGAVGLRLTEGQRIYILVHPKGADGLDGYALVASRVELRACDNALDDDGDGRIDRLDPGCVDAQDDDEADPAEPPTCSNGVDDDDDGAVDYPDDDDCEAAGDHEAADGACGEGFAVRSVVDRGGVFPVDTSGLPDRLGATCAGGAGGGEGIVALTLTGPARVEARTGDSTYDTALFVRGQCLSADSEIACNDDDAEAGGRNSRVAFPRLEAGIWYFVVDGFSDASGQTTLVLDVQML